LYVISTLYEKVTNRAMALDRPVAKRQRSPRFMAALFAGALFPGEIG
jgi:hypothetical protein